MVKRELGGLSTTVDTDAPRPKRRRESGNSSIEDAEMEDAGGMQESEGKDVTHQSSMDPEEVRVHAQAVWQAVKNAVSKECVFLYAIHFLYRSLSQSSSIS